MFMTSQHVPRVPDLKLSVHSGIEYGLLCRLTYEAKATEAKIEHQQRVNGNCDPVFHDAASSQNADPSG